MDKSLSYSQREQSPAYQLWQVSNAWRRMANRALEPLGLTHVQFVLLVSIYILASEKPPVSQACVARFADIDENMNSQVIRVLERKELIRRVPSSSDKRAFALELTPAGEDMTIRAKAAVRAESDVFFAPLGDQCQALVELLRRVSESHSCR